ncbi:formin-like protein 11 [Mercurialis annua]|uniref:formin-like protein 11 n=1 Tax=Mercurialis annua TaxID=3986 RepID=UPI00215EC902|nr:formin-like protein 11 [Mercurialis annua]
MGSSTQILHMFFIIIITIFMFLSLQSAHILSADASLAAAEYLKVRHSQQELEFVEEISGENYDKKIQKVSGDDENEEKETLIVQKFRALLGLRSFRARSSYDEYLSPAPSPSLSIEAEAPSPAPSRVSVLPIQVHSHPPLHHSKSNATVHKILKKHKDKGRFKRILAVVLVSTGAAFIVCVLGLIWVSRKFRKDKSLTVRLMSVYRKKGRSRGKAKFMTPHKSASKVRLNPGLDLLYLNSLERDLEQHSSTCFKQPADTLKIASNRSTPKHALHNEREETNQEMMLEPEFDNASSSSATREILSVHEDIVESVKYDSDGGNFSPDDEVIPVEVDSSDDESFHSFVDSHSSHIRLSNASAGSLTDLSEVSPSNGPKISSSPINSSKYFETKAPQSPNQLKIENVRVLSPKNSDENLAPLPPPPPPLPPPPPASGPSPFSTRITSKPTCSSPSAQATPQISPRSSKSPKTRPFPSSCSSPFPKENGMSTKNPPPPPCPPPFMLRNTSSAKGPPPPPCPPPFTKGNTSGSTKGPPTPPSLLPQSAPLGKDGVPLPKLKPLHWDKVRAAPDRSMVWDKIRSSSFEFDEEMIESLFGYNLQNTMKNDEAKSKSPSPSKHVLEPKRLQNLTILSKALNSTSEQVCEALYRGSGLSLQQLEALSKMVPTKEEGAKLAEYKGNISQLGSAEKFVKVALTIPFAFSRVEAMLYRETFEDEVVHLRNSFSMLEEACKELRSSRLFLKLLEAVLKTGNRMNVGTIRGGARAFKLDALLKLADVKGTDGKTTLLHFVVQEIVRSEGIRVSDSIMGRINQTNKSKTIQEREEDYKRMGLDLVSGLSTELFNVKKTATIDLDVLASSVSNLSDGMTKLQNLVKDLSTDEKSQSFVHAMKTFLNYAQRNLKLLKEDEDKVLLHVKGIAEYFHGVVSKEETNPLRIFVIVRDFLGMLDHVCKELRSLKVSNTPNPLAPFR